MGALPRTTLLTFEGSFSYHWEPAPPPLPPSGPGGGAGGRFPDFSKGCPLTIFFGTPWEACYKGKLWCPAGAWGGSPAFTNAAGETPRTRQEALPQSQTGLISLFSHLAQCLARSICSVNIERLNIWTNEWNLDPDRELFPILCLSKHMKTFTHSN